MKWFLIVAGSMSAVAFIGILFCAVRSAKPFRSLIFNAVLGLSAVIAINLTARFTGVFVPINWFTVLGSAIYGIPAVIFFLLLPFVFM